MNAPEPHAPLAAAFLAPFLDPGHSTMYCSQH